jgi:uncharacterized protein YjiK
MPFIVWVTACGTPRGEVIAQIPEASGISYCSRDDTLIVANDEGRYYRLTTNGKIIQEKKLGSYDLEGVVCEEGQIFFALEDKGVLLIDIQTGKKQKIAPDTQYLGKKLSLFDKKSGVEGIAKAGKTLYLAKQSNKKKRSFVAVVSIASSPPRIIDVIKHQLADTAGLAYHKGYLYMVSDKEDLLVKYDLHKKKREQEVKLGKGAWEGIAFDTKGNVYLADDNGRVVKYKKKKLGL